MQRVCRIARAERGITLIGLLFWAIVVAFVALIIVRVLPTVNEYTTPRPSIGVHDHASLWHCGHRYCG